MGAVASFSLRERTRSPAFRSSMLFQRSGVRMGVPATKQELRAIAYFGLGSFDRTKCLLRARLIRQNQMLTSCVAHSTEKTAHQKWEVKLLLIHGRIEGGRTIHNGPCRPSHLIHDSFSSSQASAYPGAGRPHSLAVTRASATS
jgi:hypothetical protein